MTTEELKKEAEKYAKKWARNEENEGKAEWACYYNGYLAGAKPREKRIAELEATCNKWFEHLKNREEELLNELNNQNVKYNKQIEELEDKLANADYQLEGRDIKIKELEAQIEKMKNWCNCKNYQQCLIELAEQGKGMKPSECCVNCKKWEIKEK